MACSPLPSTQYGGNASRGRGTGHLDDPIPPLKERYQRRYARTRCEPTGSLYCQQRRAHHLVSRDMWWNRRCSAVGPKTRSRAAAITPSVGRLYYVGEKTHIFTSRRFSSRMKAKGKTHVCFPKRSLIQPGVPLQAASATPRLALVIFGCKCVQ